MKELGVASSVSVLIAPAGGKRSGSLNVHTDNSAIWVIATATTLARLDVFIKRQGG
jgi:hypothetical protein